MKKLDVAADPERRLGRPARKRIPRLLYHYTSAAGLIGILDSGHVYASHYRHLNDVRELMAGWRVAQKLIRAARQRLFLSGAHKDIFGSKLLFAIGNRPFTEEWPGPGDDVYVASFSENGDSLPQWRAYGDDGAGFALGVSPGSLLAGVGGARFELLRCVYRDEDLQETLEAGIVRSVRAFEKSVVNLVADVHDEDRRIELATGAGVEFLTEMERLRCSSAACFKNVAFESEAEWRFVAGLSRQTSSPAKYRSSRFGVTPYTPMPLDPACIREIVIGPKHSKKAATFGLKHMLAHREIAARVRRSKLSYR